MGGGGGGWYAANPSDSYCFAAIACQYYYIPVVTVSPQNAVSKANLDINMRIGEDHDDEGYVGPHDLHDVVDLPVQDDAASQVWVVPEATEDADIKLGDGGEKDAGR